MPHHVWWSEYFHIHHQSFIQTLQKFSGSLLHISKWFSAFPRYESCRIIKNLWKSSGSSQLSLAQHFPSYSPNAISSILASLMIGISFPYNIILAVSCALDNGLEIHRSNGISRNPSAVSSAKRLPNWFSGISTCPWILLLYSNQFLHVLPDKASFS